MPYYIYKVSLFCTFPLFLQVHFACVLCFNVIRQILLMTDGLNAVLPNDRAAPTDTNPKNLELASLQSVTAIRLDQLVYSPNCYIQIFQTQLFLRNGSNPQPFEVKVQCTTDCAIYPSYRAGVGRQHESKPD